MIRQGLTIILNSSTRSVFSSFRKVSHSSKLFSNVSLYRFSSTETPRPEQTKQKKLTEMDFDTLIQLHTQESLSVAESKVQSEEKKIISNQQKLNEMAQQMQFFEKHAEEIKQKELKLIQNIEEQEQQLKRVKFRADRQVEDSKKYGITKIAKELLEAADCINRCKNQAIKEYPDSKDPYILSIVETQKKLAEVLKSFEIQEFDPTGKQFDANTQESLLEIPCMPGFQPGTVATTMRTGYLIQGRLLRSARVGIFSK